MQYDEYGELCFESFVLHERHILLAFKVPTNFYTRYVLQDMRLHYAELALQCKFH